MFRLKSQQYPRIFKITLVISGIILSLYYMLASNYGSKLLMYCCYRLYNYTNQYNIIVKTDVNKIQGNLLQGIYLNNLTINHPAQRLNLHINTAKVKINVLQILQKTFNLTIQDISGNLNEYPIEASINLIVKSKKLYINGLNFLKIGENLLYLSSADTQDINLQLKLSQLQMFMPELTGNLEISGKISNNLQELQAKIISKDLKFKDFDIYKLTNTAKNIVTVTADLTSKLPNITFWFNWQDLSGIMHFYPTLTRLKGVLVGSVNLELTNDLPKITTLINIKDVSVSLPAYGIKIKPLNLQIQSMREQNFKIAGEGTLRNTSEKFKINGKLYPFNLNRPSRLNIHGKNLEFINTEQYHLFGDFDLDVILLWLQRIMEVHGNIKINTGKIDLTEHSSSIIKSKDVIFVNSNSTTTVNVNNNFKILPNIKLRIEETTRLLNQQLDAVVSGKMRLYGSQDHDNTLLAEGRITIKHGIYNLAGRKFTIEKGRIIYLPGTLITNPLLDINVIPTHFGIDTQHKKDHLYIEGTMNNPIIKDSGVFNETQAMLHLLNFSNNKFNNNIKKKFNLEEFEIQENTDLTTSEFENLDEKKSLLDNKNFVVSKKLFNNLYLRYLKPLNTPENKLKLNQQLNNNWAIELGTSTEEGYGADLKFYKESK